MHVFCRFAYGNCQMGMFKCFSETSLSCSLPFQQAAGEEMVSANSQAKCCRGDKFMLSSMC